MNLFGIGPVELLVIAVVALIVLGPVKMVDTAKTVGKTLKEIQRAASELPRAFSLEEELKKEQPGPERQQVSKNPDKPEEGPGDHPVPRA